MDFHIHSRWSLDIPNGPLPEDYLEIAEENRIHICFMDHYELFLLDPPKCPYPEKQWLPKNTFKDGKWEQFLENMDEIKSSYPHVSSGLEIDYYPNLEDELRNFIDDYGGQFDMFLGSLHETEHWRPVTIKEDLIALIKKHGSFDKIVGIYFDLEKKMIESGLFHAIAHIDTIYRFCNDLTPMKPKYNTDPRTLEIIDLCKLNDIWMEINLSGLRYSVHRPFPTKEVLFKGLKSGAKFFVGSDSHSVKHFKDAIPEIKAYNKIIRDFQYG